MKKLIYLIIAVAVLGSCATEKNYTLNGTIEGADSAMVFLKKRVSGQFNNIDSAVIVEGTFVMNGGSVEYPEMVYFMVDGKRGAKTFFLENSKMTVTGHADSIANAVITGSVTQTEYDSYNEQMKPFNDQMSTLNNEWRAVRGVDEVKAAEIEAQLEKIYEESEAFQKEFVKSNVSSFASLSILRNLSYGMEGVEIEEYLAAFDPKVAVSQVYIDLKERASILNSVAIGMVAPDFEQADIDGNMLKMSDLNSGKYLFIDFWAAWCGPCRAENPNVVLAYEKFHPLGLEILGVSLDSEKDKWLEAIEKDQLTWTHVSDLQYWNNAAAKSYGVNSIPANFLLDAEGKIIAKNLRAEKLHEKLAELLAE